MEGVFRHRDFRLLLYGQAASTIGDRKRSRDWIWVIVLVFSMLAVPWPRCWPALLCAFLVRDVRQLVRL